LLYLHHKLLQHELDKKNNVIPFSFSKVIIMNAEEQNENN
jgi:hypothetical protein